MLWRLRLPCPFCQFAEQEFGRFLKVRADPDVWRTGNFEVTAVIKIGGNDGEPARKEEVLLHSNKQNGHLQVQRFVRTKEEQVALVDKIERILLGKHST